MENFEQKWNQVTQLLLERFGKIPDMEGIIFLIGINEVGFDIDKKFKKEEKQDLMHVATCTLMSFDSFYTRDGYDNEGWPHFIKNKDFPHVNVIEQEKYLKEKVIQYFELDV